jgi:predicted Kef-type K+ transport protein
VQVESLAQVGVQLLLFTLGLEFSLAKLRAVQEVALLGERVGPFMSLVRLSV